MATKAVIGLIGPGLVGGELLTQLCAYGGNHGIKVHCIANSKRMAFAPTTLSAETLKDEAKSEDVNMEQFASRLLSTAAENSKDGTKCIAIIADCTSSNSIASQYPIWLEKGISIATPNKKAFSGDRDLFDKVMQYSGNGESTQALCMSEATVGAGLPLIATLKDLLATGDKIKKISGVLSGTISYLFNSYSSATRDGAPEKPFSAVVSEAKSLGYTEPDPRDDLSGSDFARKIVILARLSGLGEEADLSRVAVGSLVPEPLRDQSAVSIAEFMEKLPSHDGSIAALEENARAEGKVVRMVGCVDVEAKECSVALESVPKAHPAAGLAGSDNVVAFYTERYPENPLVVRGAGAGAAVTAHGVFRDIIEATRRLAK